MDEQSFERIDRPRLLAGGLGDRDIRAQVALGGLRRYWRGQYGGPVDDEQEAYRRTVLAAAAAGGANRVISHHSAAVLHGLPLLGRRFDTVHFTAPDAVNGSVRACQVHGAPLRPNEIVVVDGVPVTSIARTAVDVARHDRSFAAALTVLDGALRAGVQPRELQEVIARARGWKGIGFAREALLHADGAAESVGESWSRALMIGWGDVPLPKLQPEISLADGSTAYADFGWFAAGRLVAVGEFDGLVKYGRLLRPGEDPGDAVVREKIREDLIRDEDVCVGRWIWDNLRSPELLRRRLTRTLVTAGVMAA